MNKKNIIIVLCILVILIVASVLGVRVYHEYQAQKKFESLAEMETEIEEATEESDIFSKLGIKNPDKDLDWDYLWEQNEDIYAWIYIPGTDIDYPILQHESDNSYYLDYNLDGTKGYPGCIYTENLNTKDFTDRNTVIYGHNMKNGTMFADLHEFEDAAFFAENRYVFIYMPDKILIYDIFAAYKFTDAHILYNYDCSTATSFDAYLDMVFRDYGDSGNFREGVEVTSDDNIITLATCVSGESDRRYLVQGVLVGCDGEDETALEIIKEIEETEQAE